MAHKRDRAYRRWRTEQRKEIARRQIELDIEYEASLSRKFASLRRILNISFEVTPRDISRITRNNYRDDCKSAVIIHRHGWDPRWHRSAEAEWHHAGTRLQVDRQLDEMNQSIIDYNINPDWNVDAEIPYIESSPDIRSLKEFR